MNGDTPIDPAEAQLPDDADELAAELADDVDATIERLGDVISVDDERSMATPFGTMTEADLLGLIRPSLWQWVASKEDLAIRAIALIHRATGDLLDHHAPDRDVDELAREAIEEA